MRITKQFAKAAVALVFTLSTGHAIAAEPIAVFKSSTCGCCGKWIDHLRKSGFEVRSTDIETMSAVKARFGVPTEMRLEGPKSERYSVMSFTEDGASAVFAQH